MPYNYTEPGNPQYAGTPHRKKIGSYSSTGDEGYLDGVDDPPPVKNTPTSDSDEIV